MAATNANPIDLSKARIADLQEDITSRVDTLKRAVLRRSDIAMGTARDAGLTATYSASGNAVKAIAGVVNALPFAKPVATALDKRADRLDELSRAVNAPAIEGYDDLNVKQITEALVTLSPFQLTKVRDYEVAHKNRKTVAGAIERLLR